MSVCFYPINVKTAEPIGPKFFVGPQLKVEIEDGREAPLKPSIIAYLFTCEYKSYPREFLQFYLVLLSRSMISDILSRMFYLIYLKFK